MVGGVLAVALAGGGLLWYGRATHEVGTLEAVRNMDFPMGTDMMVGDKDGHMCHQVLLRMGDKPDRYLPRRMLPGDFRKMSAADKMAVIKQAAAEDVEASGEISCLPQDEWFLDTTSAAYAQPHCSDCGGGCGSWSCPANLVVPLVNCVIPGPNCAVTILCCGGSCQHACQ